MMQTQRTSRLGVYLDRPITYIAGAIAVPYLGLKFLSSAVGAVTGENSLDTLVDIAAPVIAYASGSFAMTKTMERYGEEPWQTGILRSGMLFIFGYDVGKELMGHEAIGSNLDQGLSYLQSGYSELKGVVASGIEHLPEELELDSLANNVRNSTGGLSAITATLGQGIYNLFKSPKAAARTLSKPLRKKACSRARR
jgi:hypothetical protein